MIKLYKRKRGQVTDYHEAWAAGSTIMEHWGKLGAKGNTREHALDAGISEEENVQNVLAQALSKGFEPIAFEAHAVLLIEYPVEGMGNAQDLEKRYALQDRMDEILGWTGLGNCDGGSIGSGTMEVCCFVVDFDVAKRVIEEDLTGSPFADYSRIYNEGAD